MLPDISSRGNFLFDKKNSYCVNTAYIISTNEKSLLAILNSKLITFFYRLISSEIRGGYLRFIYQYLINLPIKNMSDEEKEELAVKARYITNLSSDFQTKKTKFLNRITDNFDLDKLSKKLEAFYETDFKAFLKELKKKKVTLTLKDQDEWEEYFETYQKELLEIQTQINTTDKQIDEMVYALYGLSEDEVAVVAVVEGR